MTTAITDLLAQLEAPGTFATRLRAPADDLEIAITGVGQLTLPITARVAQKLRSVARPSLFGLREQSLHDPTVRNTWEIATSRVKIAARRWKPALAKHLATVREELGLPEGCELKAIFDKLVLYEEGQFFKAHQDSEKSDDMVATLVVVLPSEYGGGSLSVEHRGEKKSFRRIKSQSTDLSLLAFYADCHHEVSAVSKGFRIALTYQLLLEGQSDAGPLKAPADLVNHLTERVREHFSVPIADRYRRTEPVAPERFVYLLDHEYTERSLSWNHLKNGDRMRVAALQKVAEQLDCEHYLALAEVHESWMCEDDYHRERYGRRRWDMHEETSDDDSYELIELQESTIELTHWLSAEGKLAFGVRGTVEDAELHFTKPSVDMDPFKSEHEGYQGNYGNTVDRWYHRAAFVMWPRDNTFALQAQMSPQWAVDLLLALPRKSTTELEAKVRKILPRWGSTAGSIKNDRFFATLLKLSTRIDDAKLAQQWLLPLGVHRLQTTTARRDLVALVDKHGSSWGETLFSEWTKDSAWRTPPWVSGLADLCEDLYLSERPPCRELATWLLKREAKISLDRCRAALKQHQAWLDLKLFSDESTYLAHVLAAAVAMSELRVVDDVTALLLGDKPRFPVLLLLQVLQKCVARSPALRAQVTGSALHRVCLEHLEMLLQTPARASGDWSITQALSCPCADCKELARVLRSNDEGHDWPLAKDRRQHIHRIIDSAKLPVLHTTLRLGSPHVLQLRKDQSLFSREADYRAKLKTILRELPPMRSR